MLKRFLKNQKGLTLVELLAVIVILGIVAAIAVPTIGSIIEKSKFNAVKADAIQILNASKLYVAEAGVPQATTSGSVITKDNLQSYISDLKNFTDYTVKVNSKGNVFELNATSTTATFKTTISFTNATVTEIDGQKDIPASGASIGGTSEISN